MNDQPAQSDNIAQKLAKLDAARDLMGEDAYRAAMAKLGVPSFRADVWHLPDKPLLGFVRIPAGWFIMGSDPTKDDQAYEDELPQHSIELGEYYMARWPVTVGQYRAFVKASGYETFQASSLRGVDNHPVTFVTWHDAVAYCTWLTRALKESEKTPAALGELLTQGWQISLPSEAEWEKAARGAEGQVYPWGERVDSTRANTDGCSFDRTSPLGCFPNGASPYGIEEMSGNVWEWTRSHYQGYPYNPHDGREDLSTDDSQPWVLRGGSWYYSGHLARCASRFRYGRNGWNDDIGFRVVLRSG